MIDRLRISINCDLRGSASVLSNVAMSLIWRSFFLLLCVAGLTGCASTPSTTSPESSPQAPGDDALTWSTPIADGAPASPATKPSGKQQPPPGPVQLRYPRSSTPWLGVELRATEAAAPGVIIARVVEGSPAAAAGLRPLDVLLQMGDTPSTTPAEVSIWVREQVANSEHPLMILRGGQQTLIRVQLAGTPEFEDRLRLALVGRKAPEITGVATFQGEASSLKELRGQVVILEFWASYCGVCRYLAPVLDEWHRSYKPQGGHVIGITIDPPALGLRVAGKTGMHYTLASDPEGEISRTYLATQIPTVVIIDRGGIVRDVMVGYDRSRLEDTEDLIASLLKGDP